MKTSILPTLALAGLLTPFLAAAATNRYTLTEIPVAWGAGYFEPRRVNNHGEIVGELAFDEGPLLRL